MRWLCVLFNSRLVLYSIPATLFVFLPFTFAKQCTILCIWISWFLNSLCLLKRNWFYVTISLAMWNSKKKLIESISENVWIACMYNIAHSLHIICGKRKHVIRTHLDEKHLEKSIMSFNWIFQWCGNRGNKRLLELRCTVSLEWLAICHLPFNTMLRATCIERCTYCVYYIFMNEPLRLFIVKHGSNENVEFQRKRWFIMSKVIWKIKMCTISKIHFCNVAFNRCFQSALCF